MKRASGVPDIERPASGGDGHSSIASHERTPRDRGSARSVDLFAGRREIVIGHGDDEYRLRITRAGKLILTK